MKSKIKMPSCCNSEAYTFILEAPILKEHLKLFEEAGFVPLRHFLKCGILSARKKKLSFTVTFGQSRMTARCSGPVCNTLWKDLEEIISQIEKQ